jgi:hypothetical protein
MFRLIKLAMYALVGYAIYELYQGMSTGQSGGFGGGGRDWDNATGGNQGRMGTLTGGGEGEPVSTLDDTGMSATHRVGRGVTST